MTPIFPKKKKRSSTIYNQDTLFSDKICAVFSVEVDKSGVRFSAFIKTTPIQSTLNKRYRDKYVKWRLTQIKNNDKKLNHSFNHLLSLRETKEYKTYINATCIYVARTTKDTPWFSTQITPPSMCTIWYFGTVSGFLKNTEIGKVEFEYDIQYKEIAAKQLNTQINDQYRFFGNRELDFEYIRNKETVFENDSIGDQKNVSKGDLEDDSGEDQDDNSRGNQDDSRGNQESDSKGNQENNRGNQPEIIELLSDEDQTPEIIEISSDEESQIPEIIELSSDEEVFEKKLIAISREQTPETAEIKLNL
ncbi:4661_t:CDS:2 [Scutellospora calospora]|uniref:4661_t:CDS:1 n=1 Tax=Scutellospora calospora TaxID=85575 RepID=A0ACA9LMD9_9GLOM|nr:4661_t:CDS:2 [Scutellospora calospora]